VGHEVCNRHPLAAPHTQRQAVLDGPFPDAIEDHLPILDVTSQHTGIGAQHEQRGRRDNEREKHEEGRKPEISRENRDEI